MSGLSEKESVSIGDPGIDEILGGGLYPGRTYLIRGASGTGKTTLGLQFLKSGAARGERSLMATLSETKDDIQLIGESHGWDLSGVEVLDESGSVAALDGDTQAVFESDEIELESVVKQIIEKAQEFRPSRMVIDSVTEIQTMSSGSIRFRRQLFGFRKLFGELNCTVLMNDSAVGKSDWAGGLESLAHGTLELDASVTPYGDLRRTVCVSKYRARDCQTGVNDSRIAKGKGLQGFPRLAPNAGAANGNERDFMGSGVKELDRLLGKGLMTGTSALIMGPAGVGKSSLGMLYACAAAERGQNSIVYLFDESRDTYFCRGADLGMPLSRHSEEGRIKVENTLSAGMTLGEFGRRALRDVETNDPRVLIIDGLSGYFSCSEDKERALPHIRDLTTSLAERNVLCILISAETGPFSSTAHERELGLSYLVDVVMLARHFEAFGSLRRALSVIKKRYGGHENTIRELSFSRNQVEIGPPIEEFSGALSGKLTFDGRKGQLLERDKKSE